ncbi:MAG: hypothetical protein HY363_06265 [Candidatus Aenigmarchaeota archaeon]|nr:hypothetical protein [Candidatus Aenigmarchaeota archaeon]
MLRIQSILNEVVSRIVPHDTVLKEAEAFVDNINRAAKKGNIRAKAVLGGSFAKDTCIVGDFDVDVFVQFHSSYDDGKLSDMLYELIKEHKPVRIHGSRDYFQIKNKILFEIVPVREIHAPADARNVTDFSPFHVAWVKKAKLSDEIRLAKKFCKAQGVYGAESYRQGFSGHVLDIITIYYGGFLKLLRAAAKWRQKVVIDPKNRYKGRALQILNKSKIQGPLVVIDPTQPDRNAAAALNLENFEKFVMSARKFLKKPSKVFFEERSISVELLKKKGVVFVVGLTPVEGPKNVVGAKINKVKDFFVDRLRDFGVKCAVWEWQKGNVRMYFVVKNSTLTAEYAHQGPPVQKTQHVEAFKKQYKNTWVENGRIFAKTQRKFTGAKDALKSACTDVYVRERVKKCTVQT